MRIRCGDCGHEYEKPSGDSRCPNCREQGFDESSGTNVRVVGVGALMRIELNIAVNSMKIGAQRFAGAFRHPRRWRELVTGDPEPHSEFCGKCGRLAGDDGSAINGTYLCQRCATKAVTRRGGDRRPRDERWGEFCPIPAAPTPTKPIAEDPAKSRLYSNRILAPRSRVVALPIRNRRMKVVRKIEMRERVRAWRNY